MAGWKPWRRRTGGTAAVLLALGLVLLSLGGSLASARGGTAVGIRDFAYHPGTLTVAKGSQVTFSNSDGVAHTATDKGAFDTGRIKPGKSVTVRFTQKGTFHYICTIHPDMHGKIVVK
jgi:plastocyanin